MIAELVRGIFARDDDRKRTVFSAEPVAFCFTHLGRARVLHNQKERLGASL